MRNGIFFQVSSRLANESSAATILQLSVSEIFLELLSGNIVLFDQSKNILIYENIPILRFFSGLIGVYYNIKTSNPYEIEDLDQNYVITIFVANGQVCFCDKDTGACVTYSVEEFHQACSHCLDDLKFIFFKIYNEIEKHEGIEKINTYFKMPDISLIQRI